MELAAMHGMSVGELQTRLTVGEIREWGAYADRRLLPWARMELYLAQIAQAMGGGKLSAYLFTADRLAPPSVAQDALTAAHDLAAQFGLRVVT